MSSDQLQLTAPGLVSGLILLWLHVYSGSIRDSLGEAVVVTKEE